MRSCCLIFIGLLLSCKGSKTATFTPQFVPGPPAIVYKMKMDYSRNVAVILSEDKKQIVSYPHPSDVKEGVLPVHLRKGYLLDNRGINKHVAFLTMTYEAYAKLSEPPSLAELNAMVMDRDPLTEMCNCGSRAAFTDAEKQLNDLIKKNKLKTSCKKVK